MQSQFEWSGGLWKDGRDRDVPKNSRLKLKSRDGEEDLYRSRPPSSPPRSTIPCLRIRLQDTPQRIVLHNNPAVPPISAGSLSPISTAISCSLQSANIHPPYPGFLARLPQHLAPNLPSVFALRLCAEPRKQRQHPHPSRSLFSPAALHPSLSNHASWAFHPASSNNHYPPRNRPQYWTS